MYHTHVLCILCMSCYVYTCATCTICIYILCVHTCSICMIVCTVATSSYHIIASVCMYVLYHQCYCKTLSDFDGVFLPDFGTQHPPATAPHLLSLCTCDLDYTSHYADNSLSSQGIGFGKDIINYTSFQKKRHRNRRVL